MSKKDTKDEVIEETMEQNPELTSERSNNEANEEKEATETVEENPVEVLEAQVQSEKERYLRLFAEFENYKKRTMKERIELFKTAGQDVMVALLPVLDDFDRAKGAAEDEDSTEQFSEGVTLVYNKLHGMLKAKGVAVMESTGEDFDPEIHEAITEIPAPTEEMKGKIIDTIEKGYTLNDKIIRHAKVVVGK